MTEHRNTPICLMLTERINQLNKPISEIATAIGYDKPNILKMYTRGEAKIPIDRAEAFAEALGIPLRDFMEAAAKSYAPYNVVWKLAQSLAQDR